MTLIATPEDKIIKPKLLKVTLRSGDVFIVGGMSVSHLKFLRKNGGMLTLRQGKEGNEVNIHGKMIKAISPVSV